MLRSLGAEVAEASSASEALASTERRDFDLILSDINMPGPDGLSLISTLRAVPHTRETICIAVTGRSAPEDRDRILQAGFDAHLSKPVDMRTS